MAMRIVHVREMIEVDHHHPEREAVTDRGRQLMRRPGFDRAMIRQAGQRIRQRKMLEQRVLPLELMMQVDHTQPDIDAREKLFVVEGFGQVVVGPHRQSFDAVLGLRNAGGHDDVDVEGLRRTDPLTQLESSDVLPPTAYG